MAVPTVLNVGGPFAHTHKYNSSVAMVLDFCEWQTEQTGSVHENGTHARLFVMDTIDKVYNLVNEWLACSDVHEAFWSDVRQMIDIIFEGQNWVVTTSSDGFVDATGYEHSQDAWDAMSLIEHDFMKSCGEFEPCGVCGEYGHRVKEHDEEPEVESRSGSSYFNEMGEPLMTAAQARFEAYLDDEPREPYDD